MVATSFGVSKYHVMTQENDEQFELLLKYNILIQLRTITYFASYSCCGILFFSIEPTPILEQSQTNK
jgi:hypothetical protein